MTALVTVVLQMTGAAQAPSVWTTKASMPYAAYDLGVVAGTAGATGKVYAIGGWNGGASGAVAEYDPTLNQWMSRRSTYGCASAGVAAGNDGQVYLIGGCGGGSYVNYLTAYDPAGNTWAARASMSVRRDYLAAAANDGKIYALGGRDPSLSASPSTAVEEYDPNTNGWTTKASMLTWHAGNPAAAMNGKIYIFGGPSRRVEEYDPVSNQWTPRAHMPAAHATGAAVAAPDGKIYLIGGWDLTCDVTNVTTVLTKVHRYDPVSNTWQTGTTPTPIPRTNLGAAMVGDSIYVMGGVRNGYGWEGILSSVEAYNPAADTWGPPSDSTCGPPPDTTPPTIGFVSDLIAEATSVAGAVVTFAPTATDTDDAAPVVTTNPVSGSTFGLGTTTVTVTATDASGNSSTASFTVTVQDTTPPVIATHANAIAEAMSSNGALVNYVPPAWTDAVSGTGPATCTPASGSTFPLGATTVTCTAADGAANLATPTSFTVTVQVTTAGLENLVMQFVTKAGVANSLISKLNAAEAAGARGNAQAMAGAIGAFINELQAQAGKSLTAEQAATLIALAQRL